MLDWHLEGEIHTALGTATFTKTNQTHTSSAFIPHITQAKRHHRLQTGIMYILNNGLGAKIVEHISTSRIVHFSNMKSQQVSLLSLILLLILDIANRTKNSRTNNTISISKGHAPRKEADHTQEIDPTQEAGPLQAAVIALRISKSTTFTRRYKV